jgi:anti-anti-sigma factor
VNNFRSESHFIPVPDVTIREIHRDEALILEITGTVDMVTAPKLHVAVRSALAERPQTLVLDLSGVSFLAAAGLHILDVARAEAGDTIMFAVVADGPATVRPIELTGMAGILTLYATIDDVVELSAA